MAWNSRGYEPPFVFSALVISTATGLRSTSTVQHATVISAATRLWCSTYEIPLLSTVTTAIDPSAARKLYSSTYDTGRRMLRPSTVKYSMDGSATKRVLSSNCRARPSTLHPSSHASTVSHAIDPSAAKRPSSSTCTTLVLVCENLVPIGGIRKPLWMSFSALSQHSLMTLLSHQRRRLPTCENT